MRMRHGFIMVCGLLALTTVVGPGCYSRDGGKGKTAKDGHDEHAKGPHSGIVVEWRQGTKEEFHAEVLIDRKEKKVTVYVLDEDVKNPVPIDAKEIDLNLTAPVAKQFVLKASPQTKDPEGKSSRFVVTDDQFGQADKLKGAVAATIKGKRYDEKFAE
jgi:hypothetical protein